MPEVWRCANYELRVTNYLLHHALPQFLERIFCSAPDNAVVAEGVSHRDQQCVHEQACTDRVQKKVIGLYRRERRHSVIDRKDANQGDNVWKSRPSLREPDPDERSEIQEAQCKN